MKHVKRLLAMCLAVIMMCCSASSAVCIFPSELYPGVLGYKGYYGTLETGCFGTLERPLNYPITGRFAKKGITHDDYSYELGYKYWYDYWYENDLPSGSEKFTEISYMASIWHEYYNVGDPEVCPQEYLEVFEKCLVEQTEIIESPIKTEDGSKKQKYRVDGYSWNGKKLTVQCSVDYEVKYSLEYLGYGDYYSAHVSGDYTMQPVLVFSSKNDGSLINMGKIGYAYLETYYKYPRIESNMEISARYIFGEYGVQPSDIDGTEYQGTNTKSFTIDMPDFFDPDKHNLTLYFRSASDITRSLANNNKVFFNPHKIMTEGSWTAPEIKPEPKPEPEPEPIPAYETGDANRDGKVNITDVSFILKYIAEWEDVVIDTVLSDMDDSGRIGLVDVSLVLKRIAGWDK